MFQFTPLVRGATLAVDFSAALSNVSIHAPRARGDVGGFAAAVDDAVSIHAPRARGDLREPFGRPPLKCFNSRPSCEGRRFPKRLTAVDNVFQFTPLVRGATLSTTSQHGARKFQFTPLVRGATGKCMLSAKLVMQFQFTPLVRGATILTSPLLWCHVFQFTPLVRGATSTPLWDVCPFGFQFTPLVRGATAEITRISAIFAGNTQ